MASSWFFILQLLKPLFETHDVEIFNRFKLLRSESTGRSLWTRQSTFSLNASMKYHDRLTKCRHFGRSVCSAGYTVQAACNIWTRSLDNVGRMSLEILQARPVLWEQDLWCGAVRSARASRINWWSCTFVGPKFKFYVGINWKLNMHKLLHAGFEVLAAVLL